MTTGRLKGAPTKTTGRLKAAPTKTTGRLKAAPTRTQAAYETVVPPRSASATMIADVSSQPTRHTATARQVLV